MRSAVSMEKVLCEYTDSTYVSDDGVGTVLTVVEPRFAGRAVLLDRTLTVAPATVVLGFQRQTPAAVIRHRRALVHFH